MGNPKGRAWFRKQKFRRINGLVFRFLKRSEAKMTPEERIEMIEESIQFCIRTTGVDGGPTANGRELLATCLEDADRWVEARVLREEVLSARRRNLGDEERFTLSAELYLAINLSHFGLNADALPLALHARDGFRLLDVSEMADLAGEWVNFINSSAGMEAD